MTDYEQARNAETLPMYEFTAVTASFAPPSIEQQILFAALAQQPEAIQQFFSVITGSIPFAAFFAPDNIAQIVGAEKPKNIIPV